MWLLRDQAPRRGAASRNLPSDGLARCAGPQRDILVAARPLDPSNRRGSQPQRPAGQEDPLSEINWAVELKKIEREFDGLPPVPTQVELRTQRDAEKRAREREDAVSTSFGVYFRLTLVMCLGVSIACWPYDVTCGFMVFTYLAAVIMLIVGGIWTAVATFDQQMPWRHLAALGVIFWGLTLGAAQLLPRVGYATAAPGRSTTWQCSAG